MKYVLSSCSEPTYDYWDGYYTGKQYNVQREHYAVVDCNIEKAKVYTSLQRAITACDKLNNRVVNYQFDVVAVPNRKENEE